MINIVLYLNNEEDIKSYLLNNNLIHGNIDKLETITFHGNNHWVFLNVNSHNKFKFYKKIKTNSDKCSFLYSFCKNYFNIYKTYNDYIISNESGYKIEKIYFYTNFLNAENDILRSFIKNNSITYPIYEMNQSNLVLIRSKSDVCKKIKF